MPKIIFTSRYIRNTAKANAGNLVRYMGTREGVEKLPTGIYHAPATKRQQDLISTIVKKYPSTTDSLEYKDYEKDSTKSNATEFIDSFIENNADRINGIKKLVSYIAERPSVEKLGRHGLFSQSDDKIDLDSVADAVSNHQGILWTHVISLRREDAERLGYNNADAWKKLVRRNINAIAEAHKIKISDMQWYAAFHNTSHHPHIHMIVFSKDAKQGYLTNKGIEDMRSIFANDIFRNEQYKLFTMETKQRDLIKNRMKELLENIGESNQVSPNLINLFEKLISQLDNYQGKKKYGYLPKPIKETVNKIVAELSKDKRIAEMYSEWNKINREKLSLYYDKEKPIIPLEDNKEFQSIKNSVIKTALYILRLNQSNGYSHQTASHSITNLIKLLARLIDSSSGKKIDNLEGQVDCKLKSKIEQKKAAHGLKTSHAVSNDEDEEQSCGISL